MVMDAVAYISTTDLLSDFENNGTRNFEVQYLLGVWGSPSVCFDSPDYYI